jgi:hypothetical protein
LNLFNNIVPFLVNFISAVTFLICITGKKLRTITMKRYLEILKKQIREHQDLLISPLVVVACKLPVIFVILFLKCIKTKVQMYTALISYLLSLLPLILTFFIYVSPSSFYMKIFKEKWARLLRKWRT